MDMDMDGQFDWMDGHGWTINQLIGHAWMDTASRAAQGS
jgi:hypothetical protein